MNYPIKVVHFHNGSGGGVLSVIRNLLKYKQHDQIENHVIYTINQNQVKDFKLPDLEGAATEQIFYYSAKWNFYYTCRELAKLLPGDDAVIVAHDWLELGMVNNLGLQNPVIHFLHGDFAYYYELAQKHKEGIDKFLCVSKVISDNLISRIPDRKETITLNYFPVPLLQKKEKTNKILNIYYGVRSLDDERKNFMILPGINSLLQKNKVQVSWTIVGENVTEDYKAGIKGLQNCKYFPTLSNKEVLNLLREMDIFILPSTLEGLPVALVEAMKAGLVPLITNWHGATEDLVTEGETGFYIGLNDAEGYARKIEHLNNNRALLKKISSSASLNANELFDPMKNSSLIEEKFIELSKAPKKIKKPFKVYGSRADMPWIPNIVTKSLRTLFS